MRRYDSTGDTGNVDEQGATPAVAAVTATVFAVLAALAIPHWLSTAQDQSGPSVPRPAPSPTPVSMKTLPWQRLTCASHAEDGCAVPASIDHAGTLLHSVGGHRLQWREARGDIPMLGWNVPRSRSERWVLVGSRSAGGRSRVVVEVGGSSPVVVPSDQFGLFALPGHGRTRVTVTDLGRPLTGEVLRIEEYGRVDSGASHPSTG
jgi:hypothetical protein